MDHENLIEFMKKLVECYEYCKDMDNPTQREIRMWRERFLVELPMILNKEKAANEWCRFLGTPSETMIKNGPEKCFKDYRDSL